MRLPLSLPSTRARSSTVVAFAACVFAWGCSSLPVFDDDGRGGIDGGSGGSTAGTGGGGFGLGGAGPATGGTTGVASPCGEIFCGKETHCVVMDGEGVCEANTCGELDCADDEECLTNSLGAYCDSLACDGDIDCSSARYCDAVSGTCKDDVCEPGVRSCSATGMNGATGTAVYVCLSSGGGYKLEATCGSAGTYTSSCVTDGGEGGCTCEDDWDCPGYQECEAGFCAGTVAEPTCRVAAADIDSVLPSQEIVWGTAPQGLTGARLQVLGGKDVPLLGDETGAPGEPLPASLSPFSNFVQTTQVPIVANLNDDNGDGNIDERDFPEILFIGFYKEPGQGSVNASGVLRALHGGGQGEPAAPGELAPPLKGRDYMAVCGSNRYLSGSFYDSGDALLMAEPGCTTAEAEFDPGSTLAVGDLNYDGIPEIVVYGENANDDSFDERAGRFSIFDNTGRLLFRSPIYNFDNVDSSGENPGISLANVVPEVAPAANMAEIVIGKDLFTLSVDVDGVFSVNGWYRGQNRMGLNDQGPVSCVADLIEERPGLEIVAGDSIYGIPLSGGVFNPGGAGLVTLHAGSREGFCAIADVWGANLAAPPAPGPLPDGNQLDETAELVLVSGGNLYIYSLSPQAPAMPGNEWTFSLTELMAANSLSQALPGAGGGGPPNVDDFDGDGFPEIGTAGRDGYIVFDLQASTDGAMPNSCPSWTAFSDGQGNKPRTVPAGACSSDAACNTGPISNWAFACNESANVGQGECVCLHNSWRRLTQDGSSKVTGSSVFDFNGDGSAEVIYNDECHFRMYAGQDGREIFVEPSESRTRIEYPVVADIDNDGNAEIVFSTTTESAFCNNQGYSLSCATDLDCPSGAHPNGQRCLDTASNGKRCLMPGAPFNAGIEVWGDLSDQWVSARRIWNQYSYHVTQISESGAIPVNEPNSWQPLGARLYNTYRSQPRSFGSAPDLVVDGLQVIAPGSCGSQSELAIGAQIRNAGDLRVSDIPVRFMGTWTDENITEELTTADGSPLEVVITQSLEPDAFVVLQVVYQADNNLRGTFPDSVTVVVDPGAGVGVARECYEDNNERTQAVEASPPLPDLRVTLQNPGGDCPPAVVGKVFNDTAIAAPDVIVRIYAGDPASGAKAIGDINVGTVGPNSQKSFDELLAGFPTQSPVKLYAVVDPASRIDECNEANNAAGPTTPTSCVGIK